jgi:hypothetical protein
VAEVASVQRGPRGGRILPDGSRVVPPHGISGARAGGQPIGVSPGGSVGAPGGVGGPKPPMSRNKKIAIGAGVVAVGVGGIVVWKKYKASSSAASTGAANTTDDENETPGLDSGDYDGGGYGGGSGSGSGWGNWNNSGSGGTSSGGTTTAGTAAAGTINPDTGLPYSGTGQPTIGSGGTLKPPFVGSPTPIGKPVAAAPVKKAPATKTPVIAPKKVPSIKFAGFNLV